MKYQVGSVGRVVVVRFDDKEDVLKGLEAISKKEDIRAGVLYIIGGMRSAKVVTGPQRDELPPQPIWQGFNEPHEIIAVGTVFYDEDEPKVHVHAAFGRGDSVRVGCLRQQGEIFLVLEAVIIEIKDVEARRQLDPASGLKLLKL